MFTINTSIVQCVFPNQLFEDVSDLQMQYPVFLIEELLFFKLYKFHKQKIVLHRASMKYYENYLISKGFTVHYINSFDELSDVRLLLHFFKKENVQVISTPEICDNWLERRIKSSEIKVHFTKNRIFINNQNDLKSYFKDKKTFYFNDFYIQQRIKYQILVSNNKPTGGKWSFDSENRKKYPKDLIPPYIQFPDSELYFKEAVTYCLTYFKENYGALTDYPIYCYTHEQAKEALIDFFDQRFVNFGIYEDSILKDHHFLNHSLLSPILNIGLLTPNYVIDEAINYAQNNHVPLNSLEGFIRQILGWREFVRAVYIYRGTQQRQSNFWNHQNTMNPILYVGTTGVLPVDNSIKKLLKTGYLHHIERLMIVSNFMNLLQIHPNHIYKWFMELFVDAYDWVMVPNVYGMATYADGGLMTTKPYISGSNYLKKMSDYVSGDWQNVWDGLFWNFVAKNQSFFRNNYRLTMMCQHWEKMNSDTKIKHLNTANKYLELYDK